MYDGETHVKCWEVDILFIHSKGHESRYHANSREEHDDDHHRIPILHLTVPQNHDCSEKESAGTHQGQGHAASLIPWIKLYRRISR